MRTQVAPRYIAGNGLWNPFTGNKTWTVECGNCPHIYKDKIPVSDRASSLCPACGAQNIWSVAEFMRDYQKEVGASE